MLRFFAAFALSVCLLPVFGCSTLKVYDVSTNATTKKEIESNHGVTYYEPDFYLLATISEDKVTGFTITTLPNYSKPRRIRPQYGLGSIEWTVTLEDGWRLVSVNGIADPQIDELITAVAGLIPTLPAGVGERDPIPLLYKIDLSGPKPTLIKVTAP